MWLIPSTTRGGAIRATRGMIGIGIYATTHSTTIGTIGATIHITTTIHIMVRVMVRVMVPARDLHSTAPNTATPPDMLPDREQVADTRDTTSTAIVPAPAHAIRRPRQTVATVHRAIVVADLRTRVLYPRGYTPARTRRTRQIRPIVEARQTSASPHATTPIRA